MPWARMEKRSVMTYDEILTAPDWFEVLDVDDKPKKPRCLAKTELSDCCEIATKHFKLICSARHLLID